MKLNEFEKLPLHRREEIVKQGVTNLLFLKLCRLVVAVVVFFVITITFLTPYYNIWKSEMDGRAEIAKKVVLESCK